jgi:integral membrane protein|tara:strand:+ start:343 stop:624 length:282 start_codon:yes stop_codon:yes gene_type:complete
MNLSIKSFKIISVLEALSFLILLGIAMPLKHIAGIPEPVSVFGMAHGILFILYILGALVMKRKINWPLQTLLIVILCSVLPFGPFYIERKYLS